MKASVVHYVHTFSCAVGPSISTPSDGDRFIVNVTNDVTIICTASALPAPTIEFLYNGMILDRTDGEMGIGGGVPMRVQVGTRSTPMLTDDGAYEVSQDLTLFNARDEPLTGFQCRAVINIMELNMILNDTISFDILVQGKEIHVTDHSISTLLYVMHPCKVIHLNFALVVGSSFILSTPYHCCFVNLV